MNNKKISAVFYEKTIRLETILHLGMMMSDDVVSSAVTEAFDMSNLDQLREQIVALDLGNELNHFSLKGDYKAFHDELFVRDKLGYLIQAATPIPADFADNGSAYNVSWDGAVAHEWFYGEDVNDALGKVLEWRERIVEAARVDSSSSPK